MAMYPKKVFKIGQSAKANKNGQHWTVIDVEGKEAGSTKQENIFDAGIKAKFSKGPGIYNITYVKDGQYWNITDAEYVGPLPGGSSNGNGNGTVAHVAAAPAAFSPLEAKTAIAAAALNAAGLIVAAEVAAGIWKDPVYVGDRLIILVKLGEAEAKRFVAGDGAPAPAKQPEPQPDQEPVGA